GGAENFDHAAKAIGIAIVFDALDGRVARMTGTNTDFGVQFDSIADVVSFGIAPAILAYAWGYRSLSGQGMAPGGSKNFVGMPTPAAASMVAAIVHAWHWSGPIVMEKWSYAWFVLLLLLGVLMTSTVRYYSFKDIPWTRKQPSVTIIMICLLAGVIWRYSEYVLLIIAASYALIGITLHVVRVVRHRLVARTA